jgi:hypothetical protein
VWGGCEKRKEKARGYNTSRHKCIRGYGEGERMKRRERHREIDKIYRKQTEGGEETERRRGGG